MDAAHQTTKECLIRNFQEYNGNDEVFSTPDYDNQIGIALAMLNTLKETETARKMFSDIYESMLAKRPNHMDWFIKWIKTTDFDLKFDGTNFDKLVAALKNCKLYGHKVDFARSILHDELGHIIEVTYTSKQGTFEFVSTLDYDKVLGLVSGYKDVALIDTCDFGVPAHKEIPVKYDLENMSLEEICEAYLNLNGQPIIIEP